MNLEQLRAFVKVVDLGGFARAADHLNLPRSQISRWVAQLEAALAVQLLERSTRSQSLTAVGREVYERALGILAGVDDTLRVAQSIRAEPRGRLRICCAMEFGMETVGAWVERYLQQQPLVQVELEYSSRELDLLHEGFDLALRSGPQPESRLVARRLGLQSQGLYAAPAYLQAQGQPQRTEELVTGGHALIGLTGKTARTLWHLQGPDGASWRHSLQARLRVNAGPAVRSAALRGLGIALLPHAFARMAVAAGELQAVLPEWQTEPVAVYAVFPSARYLTPALRGFIELAAGEFGADLPPLAGAASLRPS